MNEVTVRRSSSPIAALAAVAYAVILGDLLTKLFAVELLADRSWSLLGAIRMGLVFNDDVGAFGLPTRVFGGIEVSTVLVFLLILVMLRVCRELAVVDRRAPLMLGLLAGAGAANHMDMLASPRGVADFIALEGLGLEHIVFNVADIALLAGLVLCARTAVILFVRILEERAPALAIAGARPDASRGVPLYQEPETAHAFLAAPDAWRDRRASRDDGLPGHDASAGAAPSGETAGSWLAMPSRFDRAATPALVIACSFILLYSLAIVWLPDAGRSAPSALLLALGVFGTVFVAVYAELAIAERRARRDRTRETARLERERPLAPVPVADTHRDAPLPGSVPQSRRDPAVDRPDSPLS